MLEFFGKRLRYIQEVKRDERGFTLIELLVVVIIIGILAAIAIPVFLSQRENAEEAAAKTGLRNAATAQQAFYTEAGAYAASETQTVAAAGGPAGNTDTLTDYGFPVNNEPPVTFSATSGGTSYCMQTANPNFNVTESSGTPQSGVC